MISFLEETLIEINKKHKDFSGLTIILPSKRAGGFLLNYLKKKAVKTAFAPKIISIEEFIEELSGFKIINPTTLVFKSYQAYLNTSPEQEKDSFDIYTTWATKILNDFSEIDRYLISPKDFFNYLSSIKDINHWFLKKEKTKIINDYLVFWDSLYDFYHNLISILSSENLGYQGMVYREAAESIEHYISNNKEKKHVIIGFNALNNAEQIIFQELLEAGNCDLYWDIDTFFYNDKLHGASYFIRKYFSNWKSLKDKKPSFLATNYSANKSFTFVEAQKSIVQTKYIGESLAKFSKEEINKTAIVLADENLLLPLLQSLPESISDINVTMGVSLKTFPIVSFFQNILNLHNSSSNQFYYKDIISLLNHPAIQIVLPTAKIIIESISKKNITHLTHSLLLELNNQNNKQAIDLLFKNWKNNSTQAISSCLEILLILKTDTKATTLDRVAYFNLFKIFNKINTLNNTFNYLKTIKAVQVLFTELVAITSLDFKGDAYKGLQIMGVLESRVLDFENLYITSVNEGILPSGKSNASFITYDLKRQFDLPTHVEKDAIYTYHFFRLLHRAKNITILYNNFSGGLNTGEKSRFLSQIEINHLPNHVIKKEIISPNMLIQTQKLATICKTKALINDLKQVAIKGLSPSSLSAYIRNPIDFYYQKVLKIKDYNEVEETVAANTMGTIVHDSLESLYKALEGKFLTLSLLQDMHEKIDSEVKDQFQKTFKQGAITQGKNLLIFEVSKRFIQNFIQYEISELKKGNQIKIISVENKLTVKLNINEINFPVNIKGTVDRVDLYNNELRIIDYKTGYVDPSDLNLVEWENLTTDYKYTKAFQVLVYALMINNTIPLENARAGIISFKKLNQGFLNYTHKDCTTSKKPNAIINQEVLDKFRLQLKKLILEIFDSSIPFTEKKV